KNSRDDPHSKSFQVSSRLPSLLSSLPNPNPNQNLRLCLLTTTSTTKTMTSSTVDCDVTDKPSLTVLNKRIRNLKKKLNRISQLEHSTIKNKEQEDLLKSKPYILFTIDELEKLRQPLSVAVEEEINLAVKNRQVQPLVDAVNVTETKLTESKTLDNYSIVEDVLKLIYFGSMFDVKSQSDYNSVMLTRTHERNCCLAYDYVSDDEAVVMLGESDLDMISMMSSLLISRPVDSSLSHENAVQRCIERAKLWVEKSEQAIDSNTSVTYAALREKLEKILGSEFYRITPEMKAPDVVAAEAVGNYSFNAPVVVESAATSHEQKEDPATNLQRNETHEDQSSPVGDSPKHEDEAENSIEKEVHVEQVETPAGGTEYKEQYVPRRSYNQRGNGRSSGGGRGGGRGYGNGRGGRSGGRAGPYQNGRNQHFEQPGNYYPRNYYGGRGRGGRGNRGSSSSNGYNHHASGGEMVIDFSATWCGPCKFIEPAVHDFADEFSDVDFIKIDVDELPDVAKDFDVQAMPTFVLVKKGKERERIVGVKKDELHRMIEKHRF
ncbi:hypothetical protein M8C21_019513, partial [Ambrosia artemisiifolia]